MDNVMLYQNEAEARKLLVKNVKYDLTLALPKGEYYLGNCIIQFDLLTTEYNEKDLFLDFEYHQITDFITNGIPDYSPECIQNQRVYLPSTELSSGSNTIQLIYINKYKKTGTGLHKFTDPTDSQDYLYSQFAIFHAHRVFP
jgi:aminopeptidase N